jgi:peptidyl-prolyl cis-trans isomerase C
MSHRPPRPVLTCVLALACAALIVGCSQKPVAEHAPEPGDKAVATVDGQTVWASDVKREAVSQGLIGEGEPLDAASDSFRQMLDEVIDQKLLAAEATKRKLDKDPVAQRRLAAAKDQILGNMLVQSVVDRSVNDQTIQTLYQEQLSRSKLADEIHARQIVVASAEEAEAIKKQLAAGGSFESLAIEKSLDQATRFNGGDLGWFTTDVMPGAYEAALKDVKAGQVVGPVKVDNGFAVIKVEERRPEQPITLEQARPQIVRFVTYNQVRDLLKRLRDQSKVKLLIGPPADVPGAPTEPASAPMAAAPASSAPDLAPLASSAAPARIAKSRSTSK